MSSLAVQAAPALSPRTLRALARARTLDPEPLAILAEVETVLAANGTDEARAGVPWWDALRWHQRVRSDREDSKRTARSLFRRYSDATDADIATMERPDVQRLSSEFDPVFDGDQPEDTTSAHYAHGLGGLRGLDGFALSLREWTLDRGRGDGFAAGVYETHRDLHEALAGETYDQRYDRIKAEGGVIRRLERDEERAHETTGPTIAGCPWCREVRR